jgi:hypothetical protein
MNFDSAHLQKFEFYIKETRGPDPRASSATVIINNHKIKYDARIKIP